MSTSNTPYIDRGGELVFRQPYVMKGVKMTSFILGADLNALEALCEKYLNDPSGGAVKYVPAAPFVMLTIADIASITSADAVDRNIGWMPEVDVAFWVPTIGFKKIAGFWIPDRLRWFNPYLFVDNYYAMAAGREVYGFHKTMGTFELPSDFRDPDQLRVSTVGFDHFSPTTEGKLLPLFEVTRHDDTPPAGAPTVWTSIDDAADDVLMSLTGGTGSVTLPGIPDVLDIGAWLSGPSVGVVFLKQFRDIADARAASYQAVTEAPATITGFRSGGLCLRSYDLTIHHLDSHPIAAELGLQEGAQPVIASFWADYDFNMENGREVWRAQGKPSKRKIAVLGSGVGAMSTVWAITQEPNWQENYDITVYQMGWRLGGKGASGRNAENGQRIEEHGLHMWLGFYENAFRVMREVYTAWGRLPGQPLATWRDAFKEHSYITLEEEVGDRWVHWNFNFPTNNELPGDGGILPDPWDYVEMMLQWMIQVFQESEYPVAASVASDSILRDLPGVNLMLETAEGIATRIVNAGSAALLYAAHQLAQGLDGEPGTQRFVLLSILDAFIDWIEKLVEREVERNDEARRLWILMDLGYTIVRGMIADDVVLKGFDSIDHMDFIEWLRKHEASDMTLRSAPVRGVYDLVFGFEKGNENKPNLAAGTGLKGCLRMAFTYKGAIFWKMQAGMGDTIFSPFYEVLSRRGVKFEFFHKVHNLGLSADGRSVDTIRIGRQATVKTGDYSPLVDVNGLPCWPSQPQFDQLVEGNALRAQKINLESAWTPWADVADVTLRAGEDFDDVIIGMSLASLGDSCGELIAARQPWQDMMSNMQTVQTQAVQLWLTPDTAELGWKGPHTVMDAYAQPLNTWADMSNLIPREQWPAGHQPKNIAYFCGQFEDAPVIPPYTDHGFPQREADRVNAIARAWFSRYTGHIWPKATLPGTPALDYAKLTDVAGGLGDARFNAQYFRANIDPTERYVLSVKGSTKYRLRADQSGFSNVFLAGDWTKTGINAGCVEAAVMSGLRAASGILGKTIQIVGE